jgi:Helix-turn-helix domain
MTAFITVSLLTGIGTLTPSALYISRALRIRTFSTTPSTLDELEHSLNPLSVKEAARIYGDSASNFYRMVRRGEVPGVFRKTPKGRIKICPREFVPWLRAQFAAFRGANNGAVQTQSKGNGMASFIEKQEQGESLPELNNGSEKNRREGDVA